MYTAIIIVLIIVLLFLIFNNNKNEESFLSYKRKCSSQNDHLNQKIWGPHAWAFLHSVAFAYPEVPTNDDKSAAKTFVESFACILPCSVCKIHFKRNIEILPVSVKNRKEFFTWTVGLHNLVNKQLGKPTLDPNEVYKKYSIMYR